MTPLQQKYMQMMAHYSLGSLQNAQDHVELGNVPQKFKDASIFHLLKQKGNRLACDNYIDISLLSIIGKILARILLNI